MGEKSVAADWGMIFGIRILMDATAGAAIGTRRGFGRVEYSSTVLWIQGRITSGRIRLGKAHTSENRADIPIKPVNGLCNETLEQ